MANNIDDLLPEEGKPNVVKLVFVFFITKMLAATQDIVVDGWALTMLKKYVSYFIFTSIISNKKFCDQLIKKLINLRLNQFFFSQE